MPWQQSSSHAIAFFSSDCTSFIHKELDDCMKIAHQEYNSSTTANKSVKNRIEEEKKHQSERDA